MNSEGKWDRKEALVFMMIFITLLLITTVQLTLAQVQKITGKPKFNATDWLWNHTKWARP